MGGLAKAGEIVAAGSLLRSDQASEITTFFTDTWRLKPAGCSASSTGRRHDNQPLGREAFATGADNTVCSKPADLQFPDAAVLIRVDDPHRDIRWWRAHPCQ